VPGDNLDSRENLLHGYRERFAYDRLDRVTTATVSPSGSDSIVSTQSFAYDPIGNLKSRSDVGDYGYDGPPVHAATTAGELRFGYDAAGQREQSTDAAGVVTHYEYTPFSLPKRVFRDDAPQASEVDFEYGPFQDRTVRKTSTETATYVGGFYERRRTASGDEHRFTIYAGGRAVAIRTATGDYTPGAVTFLHADRLGSVDVVAGDPGNAPEERSYDVFGLPRNPDLLNATATDTPCIGPNCNGDRSLRVGFTGQEDDWDLGLVNMRGRIYDPKLGQFTVADPFVGFESQSLNRYAYALNNPLSFTDPSGFEPTCSDGECYVVTETDHGIEFEFADGSSNNAHSGIDGSNLADRILQSFSPTLVDQYRMGVPDFAGLASGERPGSSEAGLRILQMQDQRNAFGVTQTGSHVVFWTTFAVELINLAQQFAPGVFGSLESTAETAATSASPAHGPSLEGATSLRNTTSETMSLSESGRTEGSLDAEIDAAFESGRVESGTMIRFTDEGGALSGSGPKTGSGGIWYHDNIKVPGSGPGGSAVQIRTHSANPNAPPGSFSFSNYTTQVNTPSGLYMLPDGTWKPLSTMTPLEISAAHFPAGN
jgi:RHS repeat-associated protein